MAMKFQTLEPRICMSAVALIEHTLYEYPKGSSLNSHTLLLDMDNDGDLDVIFHDSSFYGGRSVLEGRTRVLEGEHWRQCSIRA